MVTDLPGQLRRIYRAIETGDVSDVGEYIAPTWTTSVGEPSTTMRPGPEGFAATITWLRRTYSRLSIEEHEATVDGDQVVAYVTMRGRQTGPLVFRDGSTVQVLPPSRRRFTVEQVLLARFDERGRVLVHDSVRDERALLAQLGHVPPGPRARWLHFTWAVTGRTAAAQRAFLSDGRVSDGPAAMRAG
jgi:hypothetical protein